MIKMNIYKSVAVAILLSMSTATLAGAVSCRGILENKSGVNKVYDDVYRDFKALEITAAVALAAELKTRLGNLPLIDFEGVPVGNYKTVPRVKYAARDKVSADNYDFGRISSKDKASILADLPMLMERTLRVSLFHRRRLGREFDRTFSVEMTRELLQRNEEFLSRFLEENFHAIVLNAARMPTLPLRTKFFLFVKRGFQKGLPFTIIGGVIAETVAPGVFFQIFNQNELYNASDYMWLTRVGLDTLALSPIVSPTAGLITHGKERFGRLDYDFKTGKEVREDFAHKVMESLD
ncbi:MAG: hypothetical protein ACRBBP_04840 [Bdellovibrionales bacterium]